MSFEEIEQGIYGMAALERNMYLREKKGLEGASGIKDGDALDLIATATKKDPSKRRALNKIASIIQIINTLKLDALMEAGQIDRETREHFERAYKLYVPMKDLEATPASRTRVMIAKAMQVMGFKNTSSKMMLNRTTAEQDVTKSLDITAKARTERAAEGRASAADYPLSWAIKDAVTAIAKAERGKALQIATEWIRANEAEKFLRVERGPTKKWRQDEQGLWESYWEDPSGEELKGYNQENAPYNEVWTNVGGKNVRIVADPENYLAMDLVHGMKKDDVEKIYPFLKILGRVQNFLSGMRTRWNPLFPMTNTPRDVQGAFDQLAIRVGPKASFKFLKTIPKSIVHTVKGEYLKGTDVYSDFLSHGGRMEFSSSKEVVNIFEDMQTQVLESLTTKGRFKGKAKKIPEAIQFVNNVAENSIRLAVYQSLVDSMPANVKTDPALSEAYKRESALFARDCTVDFQSKGRFSGNIGAAYMFFNPSAQSLRNFVGNFTNPSYRKRAIALYSFNFALGMALYTWNLFAGGEDEETGNKIVDGLPTYKTVSNMAVNVGGDMFATIPMPYGGSGLFRVMGSMAARGLWSALGYGSKHGSHLEQSLELANATFATLNPLGEGFGNTASSLLPTGLDAIFALGYTNMDNFGIPIVPERGYADRGKQDYEKYYYGEKTWDISKEGAEALYENIGVDVSPNSLQYVAQYFGGAVLSESVRAMELARRKYQGTESSIGQTPGASKYVFKLAKDRAIRNVYAQQEFFEKISRTIIRLDHTNPKQAAQFQRDNLPLILFIDMWKEASGSRREPLAIEENDWYGGEFPRGEKVRESSSKVANTVSEPWVAHLAKNYNQVLDIVPEWRSASKAERRAMMQKGGRLRKLLIPENLGK
jgi:uncharacterized protein YbjQ (UPF0145 family)